VEGDPEPPFGVVIEGHLQGAVLMGHGQAAGEMATELGEGREEKAGNLPEAVGEGAATFRGKGYPRGGFMASHRALPRGNPRIA
jgi:hypothetical protein